MPARQGRLSKSRTPLGKGLNLTNWIKLRAGLQNPNSLIRFPLFDSYGSSGNPLRTCYGHIPSPTALLDRRNLAHCLNIISINTPIRLGPQTNMR
ncbi:hypothetical protein REIFOR_02558 [Reinekea forsetii]|uniref:Uncharacterized protein n=1 Tax=Reinekea forsetii TaxID=1336806 RepID=A0A2K8KSK0_9GAMM|nr:hypothetical protein REIFOR_02558 [Reinekea forsetii]